MIGTPSVVTRLLAASALAAGFALSTASAQTPPPVQAVRATTLRTCERTETFRVVPMGPQFPDSQYTLYFGNFDTKHGVVSFGPSDGQKGGVPVAATCCVEEGWAMSIRRPPHPPIRSRRISIGTDVPAIGLLTPPPETTQDTTDTPAARVAKLRVAITRSSAPDTLPPDPEKTITSYFSRHLAAACNPPNSTALSPEPPTAGAPIAGSTNPGAVVVIRTDPVLKKDTVFVLYTPGNQAIEFFGCLESGAPIPGLTKSLTNLQYAVFDTVANTWSATREIRTPSEMRGTEEDKYAYDLLVWVQGETGVCCFKPN